MDCGESVEEFEATTCPTCGGWLDPEYDYETVALDRETVETAAHTSLWALESVLPFERSTAISMAEGGTSLIDCPALTDELGVSAVHCKDEGANPTGSVADRGQSLAVTAATQHEADTVALASPGNGGQAASGYAARADLDATVYVPARADFTNKAMINVHGGEMNVVGGRLDDAEGAFAEAQREAEKPAYSLAPFETPHRHEGCKTVGYELLAQLEWQVPEAVVVPAGSGTVLAGIHKAFRECRTLELIETMPAVVAVQPEGCAPIVDAFEETRERHEPLEHPDTICGELEVPDPAGSPQALAAVVETDGTAVTVSDEALLESACSIAAREGIEASAAAGAAAAGAAELASQGWFSENDTVVLINPGAGSRDDDILRSHLMGKGI